VGAGANKPRVKENIFASPQAGSVRAYQAGDFMATESDSAEMLLLAGQLAAGLSGFGVLILVAVLFKIIVWPFTLFACGVFLVSVGMAVTVLIRGWQEASLRRIGVMRPTSGRSTTAATVYSVSAVVVALGGLAAATFSWFN
jgi:small-conductance mechanosensitive channel